MKIIAALFISLLLFPFSQTHRLEKVTTSTLCNKCTVSIGDCFTFKDSIQGYGLILIEILTDGKHEEYAFAAIRLDTSKAELEMFKHGHVYVGQYSDYTSPNGKTKGFPAYHFLSPKELSKAIKFLNLRGNIRIKNEFLHVTGGSSANSISEFKMRFEVFDQLGAYQGKLHSMEEVIEKP